MAFRYRLYPTPSQMIGCRRHCGDARFVWNLALEQFNFWRPGRRASPGSTERFRQLAEARRGSWLGEGSSSVQQQALRDFDRALASWKAGTHRRPTRRKKGVREGFCVRDVRVRRISRKWAQVQVPKVGWVRFRFTRPLGEHGMARVTLDRSGRWHVAFSAPQPGLRRVGGSAVGVDLGVVHTVTTSDARHFEIPAFHPSEEARLLRLERRKARQRIGSNRWARTKHSIAAIHARAADRRRDWVEKTSTALVVRHDLVAFEDLPVKSMIRSARGSREQNGRNVRAKAGLNRRIAVSCWSALVRRTGQKAEASERCVVALVNPRHTSQRCSACGHVDPGNRPTQAVFRCLACGDCENADINAAKNILAAGLAVAARGGRPEVGAPGEARTTRPEAA